MNNLPALRDVFQSVGNRLYLYESGKYLQNNPFGVGMEDDYPFDAPYDHERVLDYIEKEVNKYDPVDVFHESVYYAGRVTKMKQSLRRKTHKAVWNDGETIAVGGVDYPHVKEIELEPKEQQLFFQKCIDELGYLQAVLERIANSRSHVVQNATERSIKVVQINLPDKLPLKKLKAHYNSYLSITQAALFLKILQELQVVPPYNVTDIGRLGELMFACNQKGISDGITSIDNDGVEENDLKFVQALLIELNRKVENKLKELRN